MESTVQGNILVSGEWLAISQGSNLFVSSIKASSGNAVEESAQFKHSDTIQSLAFNHSSTMLATVSDDKQILIYSLKEEKWAVQYCLLNEKKLTCACFSADDSTIIISDRFGSVNLVKLSDVPLQQSTEIEQVSNSSFGHYGMILDMINDSDSIITADQDCKIRVSPLDRIYDIKSFCLGHSKYVCKISAGDFGSSRLFSASADGTIRLWDTKSGKQLACVSLEDESDLIMDLLYHSPSKCLIAIVEDSFEILMFTYDPANESLTKEESISWDCIPSSISCDSKGIWMLSSSHKSIANISLSEENEELEHESFGLELIDFGLKWLEQNLDPDAESLLRSVADIAEKGELAHQKRSKVDDPHE